MTIFTQFMNVYLTILTKAINHALIENIFQEQLKKVGSCSIT